MKRDGGSILPVALLLTFVVSTLVAGALSLATLRGKLGAHAARRARGSAAAEGAVWLGISLAARELSSLGEGVRPPTAFGDVDDDPRLPPGSMPVTSPLLPPGTGLWIAPRLPGRALVTARAAEGSGELRRVGHLEYLETTPFSFGLILASTQEALEPAVAVAGRMATCLPDGATLRWSRLDLGLFPPVPGPGVGWTIAPTPAELLVVGGAIEILDGTPPEGRATAIGASLPEIPIRFPDGIAPPPRHLIIRRPAPLPAIPLPGAVEGSATLLERCAAAGLVITGPPPFEGSSPEGRLSWDGDRMEIEGVVVIDSDATFPEGTTYSGRGILAITGDARFEGDLLPNRGFPTEDFLAVLVGREAAFLDDGGHGGTIHALLSATALRVRGPWTVFGTVFAGGISGPPEASLSVCPPPQRLLPLDATPLARPPSWLLLEAGCRDPDVRW